MTQERTEQLSKSMLPREIKEGQTRKFKLIGAGSIDPVTDLPSYNSGAVFEGVSQTWDREKKENVIIKNITGKRLSKDKEGKDVIEEIVSPVEFDAYGVVYVDHTQPQTYVFLARDERCETNPYRSKKVPAMWYEVIESNIKEKAQLQRNLKHDAMTLVKNSDIKDVIAIGKVLAEKRLVTVNFNDNPSDIRWAIENVCDTNPSEVIRAGKEKLPKIKIDISDAMNFGEIEFMADGNTWEWTKEYGDAKIIQKVEPGSDPIESLAKFMLQEEEDMKKKKAEERTETILKKLKATLKETSVEV